MGREGVTAVAGCLSWITGVKADVSHYMLALPAQPGRKHLKYLCVGLSSRKELAVNYSVCC